MKHSDVKTKICEIYDDDLKSHKSDLTYMRFLKGNTNHVLLSVYVSETLSGRVPCLRRSLLSSAWSPSALHFPPQRS